MSHLLLIKALNSVKGDTNLKQPRMGDAEQTVSMGVPPKTVSMGVPLKTPKHGCPTH